MEKPVKINKTITLLLLIANAFYLLMGIVSFFKSEYQLIKGSSGVARAQSSRLMMPYYFGQAFFGLVLFAGLFWALFVFKERRLVKSGIVVNFACKILFMLISVIMLLLQSSFEWDMTAFYDGGRFLIQIGTAYMVVTCFLVKHPVIRLGFMLFGFLSALFFIPEYFTKIAMPDWYYKNFAKLTMIPFFGSMLLYLRMYLAALRQEKDDLMLPVTEPEVAFNFDKEV